MNKQMNRTLSFISLYFSLFLCLGKNCFSQDDFLSTFLNDIKNEYNNHSKGIHISGYMETSVSPLYLKYVESVDTFNTKMKEEGSDFRESLIKFKIKEEDLLISNYSINSSVRITKVSSTEPSFTHSDKTSVEIKKSVLSYNKESDNFSLGRYLSKGNNHYLYLDKLNFDTSTFDFRVKNINDDNIFDFIYTLNGEFLWEFIDITMKDQNVSEDSYKEYYTIDFNDDLLIITIKIPFDKYIDEIKTSTLKQYPGKNVNFDFSDNSRKLIIQCFASDPRRIVSMSMSDYDCVYFTKKYYYNSDELGVKSSDYPTKIVFDSYESYSLKNELTDIGIYVHPVKGVHTNSKIAFYSVIDTDPILPDDLFDVYQIYAPEYLKMETLIDDKINNISMTITREEYINELIDRVKH